jgi:hypothetical protein
MMRSLKNQFLIVEATSFRNIVESPGRCHYFNLVVDRGQKSVIIPFLAKPHHHSNGSNNRKHDAEFEHDFVHVSINKCEATISKRGAGRASKYSRCGGSYKSNNTIVN